MAANPIAQVVDRRKNDNCVCFGAGEQGTRSAA